MIKNSGKNMIEPIYKGLFKIGRENSKWYIIKISDHELGLYLHKDKTLHDLCGSNNFFNSYSEAFNFLRDFSISNSCIIKTAIQKDNIFHIYENKTEFIKKEEMLL